MKKRRGPISQSTLSLANTERRKLKPNGSKGLIGALPAVILMAMFCFETSAFAASTGLFGRFRRARNNVQRTTNYRAYNYRQRTVSRNNRPAASKDPWWMSEPAFRSQRTRTLYSHLGYPYAFE